MQVDRNRTSSNRRVYRDRSRPLGAAFVFGLGVLAIPGIRGDFVQLEPYPWFQMWLVSILLPAALNLLVIHEVLIDRAAGQLIASSRWLLLAVLQASPTV